MVGYGWSPKLSVMVGLLRIFLSAVSGRSNNIEHALSCPNGAFPTIRHNDIRDLTAELMSEVCHDVSTEPPLQPLSGESLSLRTANQDVGAGVTVICVSSSFVFPAHISLGIRVSPHTYHYLAIDLQVTVIYVSPGIMFPR